MHARIILLGEHESEALGRAVFCMYMYSKCSAAVWYFTLQWQNIIRVQEGGSFPLLSVLYVGGCTVGSEFVERRWTHPGKPLGEGHRQDQDLRWRRMSLDIFFSSMGTFSYFTISYFVCLLFPCHLPLVDI